MIISHFVADGRTIQSSPTEHVRTSAAAIAARLPTHAAAASAPAPTLRGGALLSIRPSTAAVAPAASPTTAASASASPSATTTTTTTSSFHASAATAAALWRRVHACPNQHLRHC